MVARAALPTVAEGLVELIQVLLWAHHEGRAAIRDCTTRSLLALRHFILGTDLKPCGLRISHGDAPEVQAPMVSADGPQRCWHLRQAQTKNATVFPVVEAHGEAVDLRLLEEALDLWNRAARACRHRLAPRPQVHLPFELGRHRFGRQALAHHVGGALIGGIPDDPPNIERACATEDAIDDVLKIPRLHAICLAGAAPLEGVRSERVRGERTWRWRVCLAQLWLRLVF
mmetsp:Transcript_43965/g.110426  ORF Transcript_43965/g.110426 Transcript_43965/m.110426 type:complete len:228 (+) Transcript_43965:602-1285(+)